MKKVLSLFIVLYCYTKTYAQNISIPDQNFKNALLNHDPIIDTNNDGQISIQEASVVDELHVDRLNITSLTGIRHFKRLRFLSASGNKLANINLTRNTGLELLWLWNNQLTTIDVTQNQLLTDLRCHFNKLSNLDVSQNNRLRILYCGHNSISSLDVTNNKDLIDLFCRENKLTTLDITSNIKLLTVSCGSNELTNLNISNNVDLKGLDCNKNKLTSLDLRFHKMLVDLSCDSNNLISLDLPEESSSLKNLSCDSNMLRDIDFTTSVNLKRLSCEYNPLQVLDVRNCSLEQLRSGFNPELTTAYLTNQKITILNIDNETFIDLSFRDSPNLSFICADNEYLTLIQDDLDRSTNINPSVTISSNCNQDNIYKVLGKVGYDSDNSGCDINSSGFTNLKFAISGPSGTVTEVFPRDNGSYNGVVNGDGLYFMFPVFENPNYFNIDPNPFPPTTINFPLEGSNVTKNFCVSPNGVHNDLEVLIFPNFKARPGFESSYVIIYKNKGTTTQSGSITIDYEEDILTLVTSQPDITSSSINQLSWNFSNLSPLESREIYINFDINKPTDNPAVNDGDILNFIAKIIAATDGTPENNTALLNQTVTNSFDPNDKTCLEGDTIEPQDVGKYLHYMIRFENKGTADAINITIKDEIDTSKFDIESFIPLKASHEYVTKVNDKKEVEFIFNNINLPFDDANNDGYVLFKIKTKSTLIEGDEIRNKAAIYFDFNFPIITNIETVTVRKKVSEVPVFSDYFNLSPNPTRGLLNLNALGNNNINIQYISVHDTAGRIVGYFGGTVRSFNLSYLFANNYFIQLHTDKGTLVSQFIKIN